MRPDLIQSALIAYLKTKTEVTSLLVRDDAEIREDQWQGRNFVYPAVRYNNLALRPDISGNCNLFNIELSWLVYSEEPSSWEADKIAGIISLVLHDKQIVYSGTSVYLRTMEIRPADRKDERTWQSEVKMLGTCSTLS